MKNGKQTEWEVEWPKWTIGSSGEIDVLKFKCYFKQNDLYDPERSSIEPVDRLTLDRINTNFMARIIKFADRFQFHPPIEI